MNRTILDKWIQYPSREMTLSIDENRKGFELVIAYDNHETILARGSREEMKREAKRQSLIVG